MARFRHGEDMPSIDERVAYLEGRLEDHSGTMGQLRADVRDLREDLDRRFEALDHKGDSRFEALCQKLDLQSRGLDAKSDRLFQGLDKKTDWLGDRLNARIDALDAKVSRQFTWLVGIQIASLVAIVGALLGR